MALWIYWVLERQLFYGSDAGNFGLLALFGAVHVTAGFVVGRWWAVALPLLAVVLAAPAGYPDANKGEPFPIWLGLAVFSPIAVLLVAVGVLRSRPHGAKQSSEEQGLRE
jgi:peptidoglycan/LPS O-acetylase OafA/YrhL